MTQVRKTRELLLPDAAIIKVYHLYSACFEISFESVVEKHNTVKVLFRL